MRTEAAAKRPFGVDVSSFAAVASPGGKSGSAAFRPSDRNPGSRLILNRAGKLSNLRSAVEPPAGFCNVAFGKTAFKRIEVKLGETTTIELGVSVSDSIVFFYSPSEVAQKALRPGARFRVGGLVKSGSVVKSAGETVAFVVTDGASDLKDRK